jgi:hypothetical protein
VRKIGGHAHHSRRLSAGYLQPQVQSRSRLRGRIPRGSG